MTTPQPDRSTYPASEPISDWSRLVGRRTVAIRASTRADGDFHLDQLADPVLSAGFQARRRAFVDLPWTMVLEEHGVEVVRVSRPGAGDGEVGDVVVTDCCDAVLGSWAGDCAPVVLIGAEASIGVVHAGWRGLADGVLDVGIAALGEPLVYGVLGPCIGPCCYEFGQADLQRVAAGVHADPAVITERAAQLGQRSVNNDDTIALNVPAAVRHVIESTGATFEQIGGCTGCQFDGFSHRVRRDRERHVVAAWQY